MKAPVLCDHVAVNLQHYVLVFTGASMMEDIKSEDVRRFIWSYNLYTDHWRKYQLPESKSASHDVRGASAVAIGTDVYKFGGWCPECGYSNDLWRLTINKNSYFTWTKMPENAKLETPSKRLGHSAWEYQGKMWVFGGIGIPPSQGFLNEHGDLISRCNNQLLYYDPCSNTWSNPKCLGAVPSPRKQHATSTIRDNVYLLGGLQSGSLDDFFMMSMDALLWTKIQTNRPHPGPCYAMSLTAVTANHLVLYGGYHGSLLLNETWIFDVEQGVWKKHRQFKDHVQYDHTGTRGLTNSAFIIGGQIFCDTNKVYEPTFHLMLEPKNLQQLAMHTIYQHKDMLPWKCLPSKTINRLMDPAEDEPPDS